MPPYGASQPRPVGPPAANNTFDPRTLFPQLTGMVGGVQTQGATAATAAPAAPAPAAPPAATNTPPAFAPPPERTIIGQQAAPPPRYPNAYGLGTGAPAQETTQALSELGPALRALKARIAGGPGDAGRGLGF